MPELESKDNKAEKNRRFSQEQYDMLKRCSDKKDMTEWNEWRRSNPDQKVLLERADFKDAHLRKANLKKAYLFGAKFVGAMLSFADLEGAILVGADLTSARLFGSNLERATLGQSMEIAELTFNKILSGIHLLVTNIRGLNPGANLYGAVLAGANLKGADFSQANIGHVDFQSATVDGGTKIWKCKVDHYTDCRGVGLNSTRIDPATRELLEHNIRRMNWEDWYREHPKLKWVVKPFWLMSDYGLSTARIILIFFGAAIIFANIYYHWGRIAPPGIVDNLFVGRDGALVSWWVVPLRALYFSIITMTLGFSDMYAYAHNI